jgi:predicted transcriptional regulator
MEGITVLDMAQTLGISTAAVKMRLSRKGIEPFKYIGTAGIYTKADLETIREAGKRGRPKPDSKGTQKSKAKKPTKKK